MSKIKVKNVHWHIPLTSERASSKHLPKKKGPNASGRNTMWGVFKAYAFV